LWHAHGLLKQHLARLSVTIVLTRVCAVTTKSIEAARAMFDPNILTIGFARRVADTNLGLICSSVQSVWKN
jgi:hypothetical protein